MFRLATVQSAITTDVRLNGRSIRAGMVLAAQAEARLAHFPEAALSGYAQEQVASWSAVDWQTIQQEREAIADLARRLGIWVVYGCNNRISGSSFPQNCLDVVSDHGKLEHRYAKRLCSNTELTYWYTPGQDPVTFEVDGTRFGCALCIEVVFPHLFAEYESLGVDCLLLSSYSRDPMHAVMARAHAVTNCFWVSLATPVVCSPTLQACLFGPDGSVLGRCAPGMQGMTMQRLDPDADDFRVALRLARPWRALAKKGLLHTHARRN